MKFSRRGLFVFAGTLVLLAAGPDPGIVVLDRLFRAPRAPPEWFTPQFIQKVPVEQVNTLLDSIRQSLGTIQSVTGGGQMFTVHLSHGDVSARLVLSGDGKIAGILLRPAARGSLDDHVRAIASLAGETSVLVMRNGETLAGARADAPMAVGSAFKLVVLKAVKQAVEARRLAWDQVVRLDPAWRSLPSGSLQDWAAGTPVTIATLADLMISVSDNTAADALMALVGRDALERLSPLNAPFLTTREAFVLKAGTNSRLRSAWLKAGLNEQRRLLAELGVMPVPDAASLPTAASLDIEWRLSARELAALLMELQDMPALGINPGLATAAEWQHVAFKGGSEPDCVNLSTLVVDRNGDRNVVVVTWNGPGATAENLAPHYTGLLNGLARGAGR